MPDDLRERLAKKTHKTEGCWLFTGARSSNGYGNLWNGERLDKAHRVAYMLEKGPIPEGLYVMHTCDNPLCVNPEHLVAGTPKENSMDARRKGRIAKGERVSNAKLTEATVVEIRTLYVQGATYRELAAQFGVVPSTIWRALYGDNWRHVQPAVLGRVQQSGV